MKPTKLQHIPAMDRMTKVLEAHGFFVGKRDPKRNRAFKGKFMVCADRSIGPTDDASTGGYCIVGNNLAALVRDAYDHHDFEEEPTA